MASGSPLSPITPTMPPSARSGRLMPGRASCSRAPLRQHHHRALVRAADAGRVAAGDDDAARVHDVHVGMQDLHRAIDDGLGKGGIEQQHGGNGARKMPTCCRVRPARTSRSVGTHPAMPPLPA